VQGKSKAPGEQGNHTQSAEIASRPEHPTGTRRKKRSTRAYGFGGAVLEAGFGVVEAAGRLAAGLGAAADALPG